MTAALAAVAAAQVPREEIPGPVAAVLFVALLIGLWWQWGTRK